MHRYLKVLADMPDNNGGFLSRAGSFKRSALFSTAVDSRGTNETDSPDSSCDWIDPR